MRASVIALLFVATSLLSACEDGRASSDASAPADASALTDAGRDAGPPPDDSPWKGPFVLRPTTRSALVRWETRVSPSSVSIEVTPEGGGATTMHTGSSRETLVELSYGVGSPLVEEPDVPGTYYVAEVVAEGLDPATCYHYEVVSWPGYGGRFCTMHEPTDHGTPITVYAIGDTSPAVMGTPRLLDHVDPTQAELSLHVGDLQYYSTLIESQQLWFRLMAPLLRASAFLPCLGNHEDEQPHELDDIYVRLFGGAGPEGTDFWYHYETGGVHFFSLSSEHDLGPGSEQQLWLRSVLERVEAEDGYRFAVLYMHHPMYSLSDYHPDERERAGLLEVITAHRVPLVLSGHVHGYERFELEGVTYVTTGGGGFTEGGLDTQVPEQPELAAARAASGSFLEALVLEIVEEGGVTTIRGRAIDDTGAVRDSFEHAL